jgi:indole-3-glycerol phosphate synthase
MNTLQNVYDRLSDKTELAKHEVELRTINDLKRLIDTGKKVIEIDKNSFVELTKQLDKIEMVKSGLRSRLDATKSLLISNANEEIKIFTTKAKELGIDVSNSPEIKEIIKLQQQFIGYEKTFRKIL